MFTPNTLRRFGSRFAGSSFSDVHSYIGGGGDYTMTTVVTRVG